MDTPLLWMKGSSNFGISCTLSRAGCTSSGRPSVFLLLKVRNVQVHTRPPLDHTAATHCSLSLYTPSFIIARTESNVGATACCLVPPQPPHLLTSPSFPTLVVSGSCKCRSLDVAHVGKRKRFRGYR